MGALIPTAHPVCCFAMLCRHVLNGSQGRKINPTATASDTCMPALCNVSHFTIHTIRRACVARNGSLLRDARVPD